MLDLGKITIFGRKLLYYGHILEFPEESDPFVVAESDPLDEEDPAGEKEKSGSSCNMTYMASRFVL